MDGISWLCKHYWLNNITLKGCLCHRKENNPVLPGQEGSIAQIILKLGEKPD